jgi:hypothetical protein
VPSGLVKSGWALGFDASTMIPYHLPYLSTTTGFNLDRGR